MMCEPLDRVSMMGHASVSVPESASSEGHFVGACMGSWNHANMNTLDISESQASSQLFFTDYQDPELSFFCRLTYSYLLQALILNKDVLRAMHAVHYRLSAVTRHCQSLTCFWTCLHASCTPSRSLS